MNVSRLCSHQKDMGVKLNFHWLCMWGPFMVLWWSGRYLAILAGSPGLFHFFPFPSKTVDPESQADPAIAGSCPSQVIAPQEPGVPFLPWARCFTDILAAWPSWKAGALPPVTELAPESFSCKVPIHGTEGPERAPPGLLGQGAWQLWGLPAHKCLSIWQN